MKGGPVATHRRGVLAPIVVLITVASLFSACATTADRAAYTTIRGAVVSAQAGVKGFNIAYQSGRATDSDRDKVKVAYERFQKVADLAIDMASSLPPGQEQNVMVLVNVAVQDLFDILKSWNILPSPQKV